MANEFVLELTQDNFEQEVLKSPQPVLVDFWAEWCGPCRMLAPTIDELARDFHGRAKVGKVDVDRHQNLALQYGIQAIPTVILFHRGQPVRRMHGAAKREFAKALEDLIQAPAAQ